MKRKRTQWLLSFLLAPILALALAGCTSDGAADEVHDDDQKAAAAKDRKSSKKKGKDDESEDPEKELVPVETVRLGRGPIEAVLRYSTNLEAEKGVQVFSEAARQVTALLVEEGDRVRKGQHLVRLQDDAQRSALARSQSQLEKAEREHARQQRMFDQELISEQAFNDSTYELDQAKLAFQDAQRELTYTVVKAPISGTITARLVNLGDHITVNQHLFDIVDFDSIVARVFVPEREMPRLRVGQPARLYAESGRVKSGGTEPRIGKVLRIAPVVDAQSGTVKTTVAIPANAGFLPGMYVEVELVTAVHENALLIPKRALIFDNEQTFVFRIGDGENGDSVAERVLIEVALEDRSSVEPAGDGLNADDRIVVAGQQGLKNGARVRLLGAAAPPDATVPAVDATAAGEEAG